MSAAETRRDLLRAAETLFAQRGIDGPSLREIGTSAGQLNTNALQYHFGGRDGVVIAVLDKHTPQVESHRCGLLDRIAADERATLTDLADALVRPQAAKLDDHDGGREYLQIIAEIGARPERFEEAFRLAGQAPSMRRWSRHVAPFLPAVAVGRPLHRRYAAIRFTNVELANRARERPRSDHRLFTSHLVDVITAILGAPVSAGTERLIR